MQYGNKPTDRHHAGSTWRLEVSGGGKRPEQHGEASQKSLGLRRQVGGVEPRGVAGLLAPDEPKDREVGQDRTVDGAAVLNGDADAGEADDHDEVEEQIRQRHSLPRGSLGGSIQRPGEQLRASPHPSLVPVPVGILGSLDETLGLRSGPLQLVGQLDEGGIQLPLGRFLLRQTLLGLGKILLGPFAPLLELGLGRLGIHIRASHCIILGREGHARSVLHLFIGMWNGSV